jgi:hypothetical protein
VGIRVGVSGGMGAGLLLMMMLTVVIVGMGPTASARAEGCPKEQIRQEQVYGARLPDCRAYEQVSPVRKNLTDVAGEPGIVQAAASGEGVSFFAVAPFPGMAGSAGRAPTYLGVRPPGGDEWQTEGLLPKASPGSDDQVVGLTENLAKSILLAEEPPLAPGAETGPDARNAYVYDNVDKSYQLLAPDIGFEKLSFVDATPGGTSILFETGADLPTTNVAPAPGVTNLYEWNGAKPLGERLSLAGVLPDDKAPTGGSVAGPGGPAIAPLEPGGSTSEFYTQDTISENSAQVFFSDVGTGIVYMREPEVERTVQVSAGQAHWRAATADGSSVFYTEAGALYRWCRRVPESAPCGGEHDAGEPVTTQIADTLADVQGTLGVSNDGSYVYFVATGKLASNENGNREEAEEGADNLYEWHEEAATHSVGTTFIARLLGPNAGEKRDEPDWRDYDRGTSEDDGASGGEKSSRVAPDGKTVLLSSVSQLTSYDNDGEIELYLYDAERPLSLGNPVCVSCNPSGMPATGGAYLTSSNLSLPTFPERRNAFLTHNLSSNGNRVFFQTEEALVPEDTNNQLDVYEWERAREETDPQETEATDSCQRTSPSFSEQDGGCLYLISTGQSPQPSYFGDASESGDDVFFFTRQSLVSQDQDLNVDVYDARVDGGIPAQNPPPPPAPCTDEASCRGASDPPAPFGVPSSATIAGGGNLVPQPAAKPKPKPLTRAQKLAKALERCKRDKKKSNRQKCEKAARKSYGKQATKTARRR